MARSGSCSGRTGFCCVPAPWSPQPAFLAPMGCWAEVPKNDGVRSSSASAHPPAAAVPPTKLMARCTKLYGLWFRYEQHPTYHHTGQRAQAELALYGCEKGQYDAGIHELERMLQRGR